jgi:hypothetical protein
MCLLSCGDEMLSLRVVGARHGMEAHEGIWGLQWCSVAVRGVMHDSSRDYQPSRSVRWDEGGLPLPGAAVSTAGRSCRRQHDCALDDPNGCVLIWGRGE